MAVLEESPSKSSVKRKHENDSDDELFFQLENKKNSTKENAKSGEKENIIQTSLNNPKINSPLVHQLASPNANAAAKTKQSKLIQQKINFGTNSPKVPPAQIKETNPVDVVKDVVASAPLPVTGDGWNIEDFLLDKEWKSLLKEEFSKKYFLEINNNIKEGYKKGINRPPKELVFNALNSTKIDKVT
jgi:hypothetical protein